MELSAETKNNLELLDKILKYVKPSLLLELANYSQIREKEESFSDLLDRVFADFKWAKLDHFGNHRHLLRESLISAIVNSLKLIEMIDSGESK